MFDPERLDRLNLVDETVTLGTLPPFATVEPKQMVATVKIIPFAAPQTAKTCCPGGHRGRPAAARRTVSTALPGRLVQTRLPGLKESILDKTRRVTEGRLAALGCRLVFEERCPHATRELASMIRDALGHGIDILLIHGASAILDRRDVNGLLDWVLERLVKASRSDRPRSCATEAPAGFSRDPGDRARAAAPRRSPSLRSPKETPPARGSAIWSLAAGQSLTHGRPWISCSKRSMGRRWWRGWA